MRQRPREGLEEYAQQISLLLKWTQDTLDTCKGQVKLDTGWQHCNFNVVECQGFLLYGGILGREFLQDRAIIDCISRF